MDEPKIGYEWITLCVPDGGTFGGIQRMYTRVELQKGSHARLVLDSIYGVEKKSGLIIGCTMVSVCGPSIGQWFVYQECIHRGLYVYLSLRRLLVSFSIAEFGRRK